MTAMQFSITSRPAHRHSLGARIGGVVHRINATTREWHRRVHGRRELAGLGECMLQDIGITRADAFAETHKPFWKE